MYIKLKNRTLKNDIKYKGALSSRHLRIIAWICLIIAQISNVITLAGKIDTNLQASSQMVQGVFSFIALLPMPLFLLSNLGKMFRLKNKDDWRTMFTQNSIKAIIVYILANYVIFHFGFRFSHALNPNASWWEVSLSFGRFLHHLGSTAYTCNIFIDMLLWISTLFFLNFKPRKWFQNKKIFLFRLLIVFPLLYEIGGIMIKYCMCLEILMVPSFVFFLLPCKAPLTFVAVIAIIFAFKIMETRYKKNHNDYFGEKYANFVQTNAHSLKISIIISTFFLLAVIVDIFILYQAITFSIFNAIKMAITKPEQDVYDVAITKIDAWVGSGFGGSVALIFIIPFVMIFSYTKQHKNDKIDTYIPIIGFICIAIIYIEGLFQISILDFNLIIDKIKTLFGK